MSFQYYAKVKGQKQGQFKAESPKTGRKDVWFECIEFKMGSAVPVDANSGQSKGHRQHKPVTITKEWGVSSPLFLNAHWTNETLSEVVIECVGRAPDGTKEIVTERITLTNAVVTEVIRYSAQSAKEASRHDTDHLEAISMTFQKILVENIAGSTSASDDWFTPGA
jgi:type VI secretion system secreted protein Hcp